MRSISYLLLGLFLIVPTLCTAQMAYGGAVIPLSNLTVTPKGIEQPGSEVGKLADFRNGSEDSWFHTLWAGIPKQPITIEGDLKGDGKRLELILLDTRRIGLNGIIKKATLWVQIRGTYVKVADIDGSLDNVPLFIRPRRVLDNPQKIKLVVTDSYGDQTNRNYMVSLGELMCLSYRTNDIVEAQIRQMSAQAQLASRRGTVAAYEGVPIPMKNVRSIPEKIAATDNDVDKLNDGKNFGDFTEFHTPWGGIPKQEVVLEADLDGQGKRMDQLVLDQRFLGTGGIIREAQLWVQEKGQYRKVADIHAERKNGRLVVPLEQPVADPEKVKLVITDTYSDNGGYQVCLGEMACIMLNP